MINIFGRDKSLVVFLSTFPPRECGIATFTQDLSSALDELYAPREESRIVALDPEEYTRQKYSDKVIFQFSQTNRESYRAAAKKINANRHVKLVSIQHEFGIFGGEYGSYLLEFLEELKKPSCVTFHSMLPEPVESMLRVVQEIARMTSFVVAMTDTSRDIITGRYAVPAEKVRVIPHGIHPLQYSDNKEAKSELGLSKRFLITSFGLLGRGKGIEHAIEALPAVVKVNPKVLYLIIGATHPVVLKNEGESYRNSLINRVRELSLESNVIFYNQYLKVNELLDFLKASDICLVLSENPNQAVSGALSYNLGAGRPVIATPFAHAKEVITPEVGRLVGFNSKEELSNAIIEMMMNREKLKEMGEAAYFRTRKMTWPNVALSYMREFISITPEFRKMESNMPAIKIRHMINLTDGFGMFQFAKRSVPDPAHGYTTDDNARALIAMVKVYATNRKPQVSRLIGTYLNFMEYVAQSSEGFFNFVNYDKSFHAERNTKENLSDANARGYYALAFTASHSFVPQGFRDKATGLFRNKFDIEKKILSPRAAAFTILALSHWLSVEHDERYLSKMKELAYYLLDLFETSKADGWLWFEDILSYSNGILPEALFVAYQRTNDERYLSVARESLDFLIQNSFDDRMCIPVGQSGWFRRGGVKHVYDQQPEEVAMLVSVLAEAHTVTNEQKYLDMMKRAFDWFLGSNRLGQMVYDESTGGSYDGVGESQINLNQGAESTIMYLLARLVMEEKMQDGSLKS